ncbi:hypothetical protein RBA41_27515 [Massilia sp. CCM 9210]|uniref:hypothetical protein n=1 Tax=Massilia scottii TaxID=3057166 RepID=UPI0027968043|nr:hypothetical protein [Massilia sp. CCM 9210]MDQ1817060.1 hypothetical protein [Massilia sp. CCM 9210]
MKKTSLRKNRFFAQPTRLTDNSPERKLSRKLRRSRANSGNEGVSLREMMMHQWEFNDADIAERMAATLGRPISPEAQAFYDYIDAVKAGKASWDGFVKPVLSDAA